MTWRPCRAMSRPGLIVALAAMATALPLAAQQPVPPLLYSTFALDNGLSFIVHKDHSTPIVAVLVYYDIGDANDPPGRSGFAHLFEHLMFQETEHLKKGELGTLFSNAGALWNGTTNDDRTVYLEVVPSNRLNLAFWIEAERMSRLRVTEENFRREREVVKEERRLRTENEPYGASGETLDTLAMDYPPYDRTESMADLNAATVEDVREFYRRYYNPNAATVAVVGDVTPAGARQLAERYFAGIRRGPKVTPLPPAAPTPRSSGERRATLPDALATVARLDVAYNIPPARHEDNYALTLLASILGEGESSRLHQRLVKQEQAALEVSAWADSRYGPGLLRFRALPNQGVPVARLEALLDEELRALVARGVTPRELEKAKNQLRARTLIKLRQTVLWKALEVQESRLIYGDIAAVNANPGRYLAVTAGDIARVARKYLVRENRTVLITTPTRLTSGRK